MACHFWAHRNVCGAAARAAELHRAAQGPPRRLCGWWCPNRRECGRQLSQFPRLDERTETAEASSCWVWTSLSASPALPLPGNPFFHSRLWCHLGNNSLLTRVPCHFCLSFTARGIVALVFSCIAGILGVAVIAWYGMSEDPGSGAAYELARRRIEEAKIPLPEDGGTEGKAESGGVVVGVSASGASQRA
ncbi:hypothetical protein VTK73DRAFT_8597 [Phialemonium thermophilum]|uniref:Uncharacterized protein n=1 Tax=Phialemonium thermophilum TaxID=223376 RepID=A0ABR3XNH9_9PEZI